MTKRRILTSVLTLVLVVGLVFGVLAMQTSALDSTVGGGDWLSTSGKTLVQCSDENCDHDNCYAYSFVAVGDTQNLNNTDVKNNKDYMSGLYNWILANQESKNIQYVLGLGDITQAYNRTWSNAQWAPEWDHATKAISLLDGKIGYSLVRGNHDISGYKMVDGKLVFDNVGYNGFFGIGDKTIDGVDNQYYENLTALMATTDTEGRAMAGLRNPNRIEDSYRKIEIGGNKYIIFTLDWNPSKAGDACLAEGEIDCLTWIDNVLTENSDYQAIVTLHSFVWYDGSITDDAEDVFPYENLGDRYDSWGEVSEVGGNATPDELWDVLKTHANVEMVLCGHVDSDDIVTTQLRGDNGNTVTCMLIDGQTIDSTVEPVGLVAVFYVKADGSVMNVEYVSTVRAAAGQPAYLRAKNQFKVDLDVDAWVESAGATIPKADYDAYTFHLVLDDDSNSATLNTYYGGYNTWEETLSAIHSFNGKLKIEVNKTWNIVMAKDYTYSNEVTKSQLDHNKACECKSKTVLDMNGKTFTLADGTTFLPMYNSKNSYRASFTVKNGTMVFNGTARGVVTQHGHPTNAKGSIIDVDLIDLNVVYNSGAKGSFVYPFSMTESSGTRSTVNLNVTNCNIDASAAGTVTLFNLSDTHNDNDVNLTITGGSIKGGNVASTTFVKQNYPGDSITFVPGADGNYTEFTYADNTQLSGVFYSETSDKNLEFAAPTEKDGKYVSKLVSSTGELTKYGPISSAYADEQTYPFLLFKDGVMIHASKNWKTLIDTDVKGNENYQSGCTLLLRRDYDTTVLGTKTAPSYFAYIDDMTIDLDDHVFTRGSNHFIQLFGTELTAHKTTITLINGTVKSTTNTAPIVYNNNSNNTSGDVMNMVFNGVTFDFSSVTSGDQGVLVAFGDGTTKGVDSTMTFNDCTFYRGASTRKTTLFDLIDYKDGMANNKTDVKVIVNGGKLVADTLSGLTFAEFSPERESGKGSPDTVTLGKGSDGKAFQIILPSTYTAPTSAYALTEGTHYVAKLADNGDGTITYNLDCAETMYGKVTQAYASVENYPFAVFYNGAFKSGYATFNAAVNAAVKYIDTANEAATCDKVYVVMRRDYNHNGGAAAINTARGEIIVDLQGYKLSSSNSYIVNTYINYAKLLADGETLPDTSYAYASNYLAFTSALTFQNGTIRNNRSDFGLIGIDTKNAHSVEGYGKKSFVFNFDNVTLSTGSMAILQAFGGKSGTGHNVEINVNNSTLDFGNAAAGTNMFICGMSENIFTFDIEFIGCSVIASKLDSFKLYTLSSDDVATFSAGADGVYLTVTQTTEVVPTAAYIAKDGKDVMFYPSVVEGGKYSYVLMASNNVDTGYGEIPADKADVNKYPLVLFEGTAESGYTVVDYYSDFTVAMTKIAGAMGKDYVILVRADYTKNTNKHVANFTGSLTIDLDGHTFTIVKDGNYLLDLGVGNANGPKGTFNIKNGTIVKAGGRGVVCMNYDSNLKTNNAEYTFNFSDVTFKSTDNTYNKNVIFTTWEGAYDNATAKIVVNSTFEDCTFDYRNSISGVVMLDLGHSSGTKDRVQHNAVIKGGTILANTAADINNNFKKLDGNTNGRADSLKFAANDKGEYVNLVLPDTVAESALTSVWTTVDGGECVFVNASVNGEDVTYVLVTKTVYGKIPVAYAGVTSYPIVIFKADKTFVGGYNSISTAITAAGLVSGGSGSKVGGADCVILLRNNVAIANTGNVTGYKNNVVIDLNGYTMNSTSACLVTLASSASSGTDKTYGTVTFKNGTICYSAGGTASSVIRANGADGVYTFNFENVTLSTTNTTLTTSKIYFVISTSGSSKADQVVNSTFTNCVFDYSKAQPIAYAFGSGGGAAINALLVNCDVIAGNNNALPFVDNANNKQALAYYAGSASNDTLTVVGNIEYVLNNGVAAPTATYTADGVDCVFVKASANDTATTYKLMPKVMVDYKIKTSVTLYSNFVYNIYIPSANVYGFTVNGEEVEYATETIGDVEYYVVKVELPAGETLRDIALTVTLNSGNTTVDADWTLNVYNYTKSVLAGEYDETTKTLMKDMLVYASAAHTYFENTEAVAEKLAEINTLLGDYNAALPKGEAKAPADKTYFTDARVYLGEVPSFRFTLASGYTASDFTFKVGNRAVEAIAGEGYVEIVMYAYMMLDDVTFTVKGTDVAETYNLYSYYEYAGKQNNANLVAIVEALMKYSVSANAYRNSVVKK